MCHQLVKFVSSSQPSLDDTRGVSETGLHRPETVSHEMTDEILPLKTCKMNLVFDYLKLSCPPTVCGRLDIPAPS